MSEAQSGDLVLQSIRIACPSCRRDLRVRPDHLGRRVRCKHCEHAFRARSEDDPAPIVLAPALAPRATTFIEVPCPNCQREPPRPDETPRPAGRLQVLQSAIRSVIDFTWEQ